MNLAELIENFYATDAKLRDLLFHDCSNDQIRELDQLTQSQLNTVKEYKPKNIEELKAKFRFFIRKLTSDSTEISDSFSIQSLVHMLDQDFTTSGILPAKPDSTQDTISSDENKFKLLSAYDLVSKSHDRISIIDTDYKYVNTSDKNCKFYDKASNYLIGKHVIDIIGKERFENRAKHFFKKCFAGQKQEYFHSLEINGNERIMSCQMSPLYNVEASVFGTMVTMSDVTKLVVKQNAVILQNLNKETA